MAIASRKFILFYYMASMSFKQNNALGSIEAVEQNESDDFLINTPGCTIPNVWKEHEIEEASDCVNDCGIRAVFIEKSSDDSGSIKYIINEEEMRKVFYQNSYKCCSHSAYRRYNDELEYTECKPFVNGTRAILKHEIIIVTCKSEQNSTLKNIHYEDAFIVLREKHESKAIVNVKPLNVLILGMDTVSRARAVQSMPKLFKYFKQSGWLDYRGFQKAASNTYPNLMILHTGIMEAKLNVLCGKGMAYCNDLMMWTKFKNNGYFTAYGEDLIPDTYNIHYQFMETPTDHYSRPLFLLGQKRLGNIVCLRRQPSAHHVLDFAYQFAEAYQGRKYFGFFWLLTYSHDPNNIPTLLQNQLVLFFQRLTDLGALNNTIIIFLGDHGIRYGPLKLPVESYYDERLPMLFMWFPYSFRTMYETEFENLQLNQYRLTTHSDLHSTLWNILKLSEPSVNVIPPDICPHCTSLFKQKSIFRRCEHMSVSPRYCSCHALNEVPTTDIAAKLVPDVLLNAISDNKSELFQIKTVLRLHWFRHEYDYKRNLTYYDVAIQLEHSNKQYEAIVKKNHSSFEVLAEIDPIYPVDMYVQVVQCQNGSERNPN